MRRPAKSHPQIVRDRFAENSRIFAVAFFRFFQRVVRLQTEVFDGDIDLAIVVGVVSLAAVESQMRDPEFAADFRDLATVVALDRQRGCNALSVAHATGLPRETVRRKLNRLIEMGVVVRRRGKDYVLRPGFMQTEPIASMVLKLSDEVLRLMNGCVAAEVFATVRR